MELGENGRKLVQSAKGLLPCANGDWKTTRPCGIDYKEDSPKPDADDLIVRLDGSPDDLADSNGAWNEKVRLD